MPSRREFIRHSVAASALAACPPAARSLFASGVPEPHKVSKVLVDQHSVEAAAFASEAVRRGLPVLAVGADVGSIWMHQIAPLWHRGTGAVAGLTGAVPLFCLELLGRDYGMRVVYRARHAHSATGYVHHAITGPAIQARRSEARLAAAGTAWGAGAAALALGDHDASTPGAGVELLEVAPEREGERSLFSWVIAPGDVQRALARRGQWGQLLPTR